MMEWVNGELVEKRYNGPTHASDVSSVPDPLEQLRAEVERLQHELDGAMGLSTEVEATRQEVERLRTALEQAEADNRKACEIIQAGFLTDTITQADMDWARHALGEGKGL